MIFDTTGNYTPNGKIRKHTKKMSFSADNVLKKSVYFAIFEIKKWTMPTYFFY